VGKSPTKSRLLIIVDPEWATHPKVLELVEKGHTILQLESAPNLILSKSAHMWADDMWSLLPITLKAARARKKGLASDNQD
jgi:hypothetical protein